MTLLLPQYHRVVMITFDMLAYGRIQFSQCQSCGLNSENAAETCFVEERHLDLYSEKVINTHLLRGENESLKNLQRLKD